MATVISTVNMKGGVGKTTLTVNLATALAWHYGKRVLVVDLDSQVSATLSLMPPQEFAQVRKARRTLSYLIDRLVQPHIQRKYWTPDLVCSQMGQVSGLELLPGDLELYDEYRVAQTLHKRAVEQSSQSFHQVWMAFERTLVRTLLEPIQADYDYIFLDCAPGYNLLTRSGSAASHYYLLPARPEPLSLVGIQLLEKRIAKLKQSPTAADEDLAAIALLGIAFIHSSSNIFSRYYKQVMQRIEQDFAAEQIFATGIPMDVNVAKAVDRFTPAVLAAPNSPGAKAFAKFADEFVGKLQARAAAPGSVAAG
jgi:cellulose biosynthesis protein BcsQ